MTLTFLLSSSLKKQILKEALDLANSDKSEGAFSGMAPWHIFIDTEPKEVIHVIAGEGILEGKKIYVGQ